MSQVHSVILNLRHRVLKLIKGFCENVMEPNQRIVHCYHAQSAIFLRQYLECVEFIYIANLSFVTYIRERFGMRMLSVPF